MNTFTPITVSSSLLTDWYSAKATNSSLRAATLAGTSAVSSGDGARLSGGGDLTTPWDITVTSGTEDDRAKRIRDALIAKSYINPDDPFLDQEGMNADTKQLFALYRGLSQMSWLIEHARNEDTYEGLLKGIDTKFQSGLAEISAYVDKMKGDSFTISTGEKVNRVETGVAIKGSTTTYTGAVAHQGDYDAAVAGLTGTETFTISVQKTSGTSLTIDVDLAELNGQTLNLDNIAGLVNSKLEAAGLYSRVKRVRIDEKADTRASDDTLPSTFGLQIQGTITEKLTLNAAGTPAVYLAGVAGNSETQSGQILKLDGAGTGTLSIAASSRLESEGEETTMDITASAMDSKGNTYVVGSTDGDLGSYLNQGERDVVLAKYDSTGRLLWQKLLGASGTAEGFAIAVDGDDNVVIAGAVDGELETGAKGSGKDIFVAKYSGTGASIYTREIGGSADETGLALATAADGSVYVGGKTRGVLAGASNAGIDDAFLMKLDAAGDVAYTRQFGTAGVDSITALAVTASGEVVAAGLEDGHATLHKFSGSDGTSAAVWSLDLGDIGTGSIEALAIDGNAIYLGGSSTNAAFDGGGTVLDAHSGGHADALLMRIDDAGASAATQYATYFGSEDKDRISSLAISDGKIYAAGEVRGSIDGNDFLGAKNGFAVRFDADGSRDWTYQYTSRDGRAVAEGIGVDPTGTSVLDVLGLPKGTLNESGSSLLVDRTTVKEGQYFYVAVNGGKPKKIEIEADETFRSLSLKLTSSLALKGKAQVARGTAGEKLKLEAFEGNRIELIAGDGAKDALKSLGLDNTLITPRETSSQKDDKEVEPFAIGLGLESGLSLKTRADAAYAEEVINKALKSLRDAYRTLTTPPPEESKGSSGQVPAYLQSQLANFQAGLDRLNSGSSSLSLLL